MLSPMPPPSQINPKNRVRAQFDRFVEGNPGRPNQITTAQAKLLIHIAENEEPKWTPELRDDVAKLITEDGDKFQPDARKMLNDFVSATPTLRDLPDPKVMEKDEGGSYQWRPKRGGQPFVDGVSYDDVIMGTIGDCYLAVGFAAVAKTDPEAIEDAITDNKDGTFTVRFYEKGPDGTKREVHITVDSDLPIAKYTGNPLYMRSRAGNELWPSILEKAYAEWKGGYQAIGRGGRVGDVVFAVSGKPGTAILDTSTSSAQQEKIWRALKEGEAKKWPMAAVTFTTSPQDPGYVPSPPDYDAKRGVPKHAYLILGTEEEAGERYVHGYNPWGEYEPLGDQQDDGTFRIKLADFFKYVAQLQISGIPSQ